MSTATQRKVRLTEATLASVDPKKIDVENGVIRDCRLLGWDSENNRFYEDEARKRALELYNGVAVRMDHKPDVDVRPVFDDVGWIENPTMQEDGINGDLHLYMSHPHARLILEKAERAPTKFGFSHDAEGYVEIGEDGREHVMELLEVRSLDLVTKPATTKSLFEEVQQMPKIRKSIRTVIMRAPKDTPGRKVLMEMVDNPAMDGEVEVEKDATPVMEMDAALSASVLTILNNEDLNAEQKVNLFKEMFTKSAEEPVAEEEGEEDSEPVSEMEGEEAEKDTVTESEDDKPTQVPESVMKRLKAQDRMLSNQDKTIKRLEESLKKRDEEAKVRALFEQAGVDKVSQEDLETAMDLSGKSRTRFIESVQKVQEAEMSASPRSSGGGGSGGGDGPVSFPSDSKGFLSALGRS